MFYAMHYPDVQFRVNKGLDKKMAIEFLSAKVGGVDFVHGILDVHPAIKKLIFRYIDNFYLDHRGVLARAAINAKRKWDQKAGDFFDAIDTIFRSHPWPRGKYIGYISIFDCNPRFLEDKTFQIFYRHKLGPVYVAVHELLHFIFYDYLEKRRKNLKNRMTEADLWQLSEIANEVLLGSPLLRRVVGTQPEGSGYPELRRVVGRVKHKLGRIADIDKLIDLVTACL